jgi:hypothetical protein
MKTASIEGFRPGGVWLAPQQLIVPKTSVFRTASRSPLTSCNCNTARLAICSGFVDKAAWEVFELAPILARFALFFQSSINRCRAGSQSKDFGKTQFTDLVTISKVSREGVQLARAAEWLVRPCPAREGQLGHS